MVIEMLVALAASVHLGCATAVLVLALVGQKAVSGVGCISATSVIRAGAGSVSSGRAPSGTAAGGWDI